MLFSFIIMVVSGVAEFISPFGRLAMMIQWEMLGVDKMQWQALHIVFMVVFTVAGIIHIVLNIGPIKVYLKNRAKKMVFFTKEMVVSLVVTIGLFMATLQQFAPIDYFVKLNKSFNDYWIEEFKKEKSR
jgi:ABC-type uncharacterized transport system fused permease/ATPase subunit